VCTLHTSGYILAIFNCVSFSPHLNDNTRDQKPTDLYPTLITPAYDDITSSSSHAYLSDSHGSNLAPFSPLVTSLGKSPILQQVVDRDKATYLPNHP